MTKYEDQLILTIHGGSSNIQFALFEACSPLRWIPDGPIEGIVPPEGSCSVKSANEAGEFPRPVVVPEHTAAGAVVMEWIHDEIEPGATARVVQSDKEWIVAKTAGHILELVPGRKNEHGTKRK